MILADANVPLDAESALDAKDAQMHRQVEQLKRRSCSWAQLTNPTLVIRS